MKQTAEIFRGRLAVYFSVFQTSTYKRMRFSIHDQILNLIPPHGMR
jgi:hypothetical protein